METNAQLTFEVSHLHTYVYELPEEASPLQEDKNLFFYKYQELREYYDSIFIQLIAKDETIQGL
jgi:hypothetical protein